MTAGTEYANKLEGWFQSAPGPVQSVLRPVFDPANDLLKSVAGDPEDLVRAGQRYVDLSREIVAVAEQQASDRAMLAGSWEGIGYDAFVNRAKDIEERLEAVGEVTGSTQEVLESAAQACVEGANLIIDIVVALISFAIATFVIKAALAAFTFGASMAAWVAEQIAAGLAAMARITQVVAKVAQVLQKIAQVLQKLGQALRQVAEILKTIREVLQTLDAIKKATPLFSQARGAITGVRAAAYASVNNTVLGGTVPTGGAGLKDAGGDLVDAVDAAVDADNAAERAGADNL